MELADVACQCGCGRVVVQPRGGGPRKRFYENACRARWTRRGKQKPPVPPKPPVGAGHADRFATLESLRARLEDDVENYGTLLDTPTGLKANPSVGELRRVIADLGRLAPIEQDDADETVELRAV